MDSKNGKIRDKSMPPLMEDDWIKKHSAAIRRILVIAAFGCIGFAFYSSQDKTQPLPIAPAPVIPAPAPTQHPHAHQKHTISPPLQAAAVSTPNQERPQVKEIAFSSSSRASITTTGPDTTFDRTQAIMGISVVKIRTFNGMTAVSFKLDGSANPRSDLNLSCGQSNYGSTVNIVDNSGKRYRYLGSTLTFPERLVCQNGLPYTLAPHEIVYETFLFDQLQESTSSFDVNFTGGNQETYSIHVVM